MDIMNKVRMASLIGRAEGLVSSLNTGILVTKRNNQTASIKRELDLILSEMYKEIMKEEQIEK